MTAATNASWIQSVLPPTISLLLTTSFSILVGIYLERFKNKLIILKYGISFSPLGSSISDNYWGNIQVTHNGRPTNNLNFVTVNLVNDNNADVPKELYVDLWVNPQAQILGVTGNYVGSGNLISLEGNYWRRFNDALSRLAAENKQKEADPNYTLSKEIEQEIGWFQNNKKFYLPIFNRNSSADINLLVESFDGKIPTISVSILQTSVKLVKQIDSDIEKKNKVLQVNILQVCLNIIGVLLLLFYYPGGRTVIFYTICAGFLSYMLARFLYISVKFIKKLFW